MPAHHQLRHGTALLPGRRADEVAHDAGRLLAVGGLVVFLGVPPTLTAVAGVDMGTIACVPEVLPCRGQQDNNHQGEKAAPGCVRPADAQHLPLAFTPPAGALLQALLPGRRADEVAHDASRLLAVTGAVVLLGVPPTLGAVAGWEILEGLFALLGAIRVDSTGLRAASIASSRLGATKTEEVLSPCRGQQDNHHQGGAAAGCMGAADSQHLPCTPPAEAWHGAPARSSGR